MKATKPMSVLNVKLLLEALTCEVDGLCGGFPALTEALTARPVPQKALTLVDGPRRLLIGASGVGGASAFAGSVWIGDPVYEFAQDGDSLWWFDHSVNGRFVPGCTRQRALVLERAVISSFADDACRAYRAIVLLAGLHHLPVPALGARQGVPEAAEG